jgi:hypothetical protein
MFLVALAASPPAPRPLGRSRELACLSIAEN